MDEKSLIEEQTAYYRARAAEYDEWFLRAGRYDRGEAHRQQWNGELETVRRTLATLAPLGDTLEIAAGTGLWTGALARLSNSVLALDSVPETIELNRRKHPDTGITFAAADIFEWEPSDRYDLIFFGFWLSHVQQSHFDRFWNIVRVALKPGGQVFFVDSLKAQRSTANDHRELDDSGVVERRLNSGETYRIVKRFYEPEHLQKSLLALGWTGEIRSTGEFFLYGNVRRSTGVTG